jgi:hypothetical protein
MCWSRRGYCVRSIIMVQAPMWTLTFPPSLVIPSFVFVGSLLTFLLIVWIHW